ncbi:MAG TPA: S41 family peptidase [Bacteroidales bacterium]|jgi:carboxyl-terminal processing protease|nr:S41 family peptidase [Bacteroidales bacterium]HPB88723.1 S41 family peptidase [Bacteroidales bacterium]HPY21304.1 S41 family peptidase [Bacteroidales bacterium]HQA92693.1 S41 family peptidase [Bacteroidales bacterium]HQN24273.1 S41 family peptidase [Bacteroidales bacterium]
MKRTITIILVLSLTVLLAPRLSAQSQSSRLKEVLEIINSKYIDTVNIHHLVDNAISKTLLELDPHSTFIPADQVFSANESLNSSFEGIGIEYLMIDDTLTVQSVVTDGPSDSAGILPGDKFIRADGRTIAGVAMSTTAIQKLLRGRKGTKVTIELIRKGISDTLSYVIIRDKIPIISVDAAYMPEPGIVYVRLSRFAMESPLEVTRSIHTLSEEYPNGVILDLRGNFGGYLYSAGMVANIFLSGGQLIFYTEGLNSPRRDFNAYGNGLYPYGPLVLLVDENSASSSEIVAGAIQDWDRGVIIGRRTFGKGLVQRAFNLSDGSQIHLTIARYHTPSGRVIQAPYEQGKRDEYYRHQYSDRYASGEIFSRDSIKVDDSLEFTTLKLQRKIYGGGGIIPDFFVPRDTSGVTPYYTALMLRGLIHGFINRYVDAHRADFDPAIPFEEFYANYNLGDELLAGLIEYARTSGLEPDYDQLSSSLSLISTQLKALLSRSLYGNTAYYRVINMENDPEFALALEVIRHWGYR